jgi:hypothetical protein
MNIPKEIEDLIIRNDFNTKINMWICTKGGTCAKPSFSLNKLILYV